jgi:hypothetical protein
VDGEPAFSPADFFRAKGANVIVLEGAELEQAQKGLRDSCAGGEIQEPEGPLQLTREQFTEKLLEESDGESLLILLDRGEWRICERMGLCEGYRTNTVSIPGWNNLVAHLRIVDSV